MQRIPHNYLSDFPFVETFYKYDTASNELVVDKIPDTIIDFEFVYRAEDTRTFTAGRKGGKYYNCKPLSESSIEVHIPLSRHPLGTGELLHELRIFSPNDDFPENTQQIRIPAFTGYVLHKGPSAPVSASFSGTAIAAAILAGKSAYEIARDKFGYTGTEEEYVKAPTLAIEALQNLENITAEAEKNSEAAKKAASDTNEVLNKLTTLLSSSGNIINITEVVPLGEGYYSLPAALAAVDPLKRKPGRWITFEASVKNWLTYRYKGETADEEDWLNTDNWESLEFPALKEGDNIRITRNADGSYTIAADAAPVENSLESDDATAALAASQGKALNTKIIDLQGKVPDGFVIGEDGLLYLTQNGETIGDGVKLPEGSGGGGSSSILTVKIIGQTTRTLLYGRPCVIEYTYSSLDSTGDPTGDGTVQYYVGSTLVSTASIAQGRNSFDFGRYLAEDVEQKLRIRVEDQDGNVVNRSVTVTTVSIGLSTSYNLATVNSGEITIPVTPRGTGSKTIHFILDGAETATLETEISNRELRQTLPAQSHGCHTLEIYMDVLFSDGTAVESNHILRDLICVEAGRMEPIVAISYDTTEGAQYDVYTLRYVVYNPASAYSTVELSAADSLVSTLNVPRTEQTWAYQFTRGGEIELAVTSGTASRSVVVTVATSSISVEAAEGAALALTAANRSNAEQNPAVWLSNGEDIGALFRNFNWSTDGWRNDGRTTALHLTGAARLYIPFEVFGQDFRTAGGVIEFEFRTSSVADYSAEAITCLDPTSGIGLVVRPNDFALHTSAETIAGKIKENERVRITFAIEPKSGSGFDRRLFVYVNGYICGIRQYSEGSLFTQTAPVGISAGSSDCDVDIFNIRVYRRYLSDRQILDNYIFDLDDVDEKLRIYTENVILNQSETEIDYGKLVEQIPCLTITGGLPALKDTDEVSYSTTVGLEYVHRADESRSFTAAGVKLSVQGTSSQYYPRKNYKIKFKKGLTLTATGEAAETYALRPDAIPVAAFCLKADFAESSGTHNTGAAKLFHNLLVGHDILTPVQAAHPDEGYRTTIDGYPIAVFHKADEAAPRTFLGKYNFNNDKGTHETFGFVQKDGAEWPAGTFAPECWEFLNNTSKRCLFQTADFSGDGWKEDFEARFPEEGFEISHLAELSAALAATYITDADDDAARTAKLAAFRQVVADHFDLDNLLSYYVLRELFVMADQGAKNCMLASWDGIRWFWIFYDNDTILGANNSGLISFEYDVEPHDTYSGEEGASKVFNGEGSVVWTNLELAYADEIRAMYGRLRSDESLLSYAAAIAMFDKDQMEKWATTVYNEDTRYKYVNNGTTSYLGQAEGPRQQHRRRWLYNRFLYLDSKYRAADFLKDTVTFRVNYPAGDVAVQPTGTINIKALMSQYFAVRYGANSAIVPKRVATGDSAAFPAPDDMLANLNDIETSIYGASRIASFGDLSPLYLGAIDVSKATMLQELVIGNATEGYTNPNLSTDGNKTGLVLGANIMLRVLDITNCSALAQTINLAGCPVIEEVRAAGTRITGVSLAPGTQIRQLILPASITGLVLQSQAQISYNETPDDGLQLAGTSNILQLVVEHCALVDPFLLVQRIFAGQNTLAYIRLSGVSGSADDISLLTKLSALKGLDADLNITDAAVVEGRYNAAVALSNEELQDAQATYVDLQITVDVIADTKLEEINGEAFTGAPEYSGLTSATLDAALKTINTTDEETAYATYESVLRLIEQGIYTSLTDLEIELMEINATDADTDYERINAALELIADGKCSTLSEALDAVDNHVNTIRI